MLLFPHILKHNLEHNANVIILYINYTIFIKRALVLFSELFALHLCLIFQIYIILSLENIFNNAFKC